MRKYHSREQLPIDKGWEKMQMLLDDALPQQDNRKKESRKYLVAIAAVFLLLIGLTISYPYMTEQVESYTAHSYDVKERSPLVSKEVSPLKGRSHLSTTLEHTILLPNKMPAVSYPSLQQKRTTSAKSLRAGISGIRPNMTLSETMPSKKTNPLRSIFSEHIDRQTVLQKKTPSSKLPTSKVLTSVAKLPFKHSRVCSKETVIRGLKPPKGPFRFFQANRHHNELAFSTGYSGIHKRGWMLSVDYLNRITNRIFWLTGLEFGVEYEKNELAANTHTEKSYLFRSPNLDDNTPPNITGRVPETQEVRYEKTMIARTLGMVEKFKIGINYRWTTKTDISLSGLLSFYQSKTSYREDFKEITTLNVGQIGETIESNHNASFSVLYPEYNRQELTLNAGLEAGITHRVYKNLALFARGKIFFPSVKSKTEYQGQKTLLRPEYTEQFDRFDTHLPELRNVSMGLVYTLGV